MSLQIYRQNLNLEGKLPFCSLSNTLQGQLVEKGMAAIIAETELCILKMHLHLENLFPYL